MDTEDMDRPAESQYEPQRGNDCAPIQESLPREQHDNGIGCQPTNSAGDSADDTVENLCLQANAHEDDYLFLNDINKFASPWEGYSPEVIINNTCALDGILSILAVQYRTNARFESLVQQQASNGDIVCTILQDMFNLSAKGDELPWIRARIMWAHSLSKLVKMLVPHTVFGNIQIYDYTSDELQEVVCPLLRSSLCKFTGDENLRCRLTCQQRFRKDVKIQLDELLLRWAENYPDDADRIGGKLPIQKIINWVITKAQGTIVCYNCKSKKARIWFENVNLPPLLLLSVRMFHMEHTQYNRLDAVPLSLLSKRYHLIAVTVFSRKDKHYKAYFWKNVFYEYNPFELQSRGIKAKRVESSNLNGYEIQSIIYLSAQIQEMPVSINTG